jgi:hypothetical protein
MPHGDALGRVGISYDIHPMLCSRKQDVDPIGCLEKARIVLLVTTDKRNNDNLSLFALKVVNRSEAKRLIQGSSGRDMGARI